MVNIAMSEYWQEEMWPSVLSMWHRLDVPPWDVYQPAVTAFTSDSWKACQSTARLSYLTLRPVAMLCWMILEVFWAVAQILFRVLLSQGWIQLKKGLIQLKAAAIWFYHFQMSLSKTELLGEAALVGMVVASYYFYKWIRRQTYWERFMKWYSAKKQRAVERFTNLVESVARVSLILAMALPHTAFIGAYVALKFLFPSFVKWLAYDTYTTALISIWYPLIMTLSWVHEKRNPSKAAVTAGTQANSSKVVSPTKDTPSLKPSVSNDRRPSYMRSTAAQKSRGRNETPGSRKVSSAFSRTNPPKPEISPKRNPKSPGSPMNLFTNDPEAATRYWLRYWVVFALVQSLGTFASMVPVFGSFVAQHPFVLYVCSELKLLFFIWLFAMEKVIGAVVVEQDSVMAKALPLALIHEHVVPILLEFEAVVAETVSRATWMSLVHSQAQRILDVLVMLKMLSETRKDWLMHVLEESRTLLVPSLSLFMPSFITSFGVAYVQFVVPSAKSGRAIKAAAQKRSKFDFGQKDDAELLYLQYWVVHCLVSGLLAYFASLLWWIPFSTHATFLVWCHLSLPKSIVQSYDVLEAELKAFGMLPGESKVGFNETMTAHILQSLYSRLPSAADIELSGDGEDASRGDATETEDVPKNPKLGQALSVGSEQSSQEVSIRAPKLRGDSIDSLPQGSSEMEIDGSDDENTPPPDQVEGVVHNFRKSKPKKTAEDDEDNTAATSQDCAPEDSVVPTKDELTDGLRRSTRRRKVA